MRYHSPALPLLLKLHDTLNEVICVLDGEGRFVYINQACFRIWGYEPAEMMGKPYHQFLVEEDKQPSIEAVALADKGQAAPTFENRYYRKDGSIAIMFWEGQWDSADQLMYCTGRDITAQRKMEQIEKEYQKDLKHTNEHLERITDGFFGLDEETRITYWNKAAETLINFQRHEVLGKVLWDLISEPAKTTFRQHYNEMKENQQPSTFELYTNRTGRWLEVNAYMSDSGMSVYFRDITLKRQLHEKLQAQKEIQQQRITAAVIKAAEEERALVGKELHDNVNQVLTTVKLYIELCMTGLGNKEELLQKSANLIQDSISEIRGLSKRLSAPALGGIRLNESIRELVEAISATRRLTIFYENEVEELEVSEDVHVALYRILQEQFTNILKHAKATTASVKVTLVDHTVQITVSDNGRGFDPSEYRKGIGIENMTSRAKGLNGELELSSTPGKGCTLLVQIPLATN